MNFFKVLWDEFCTLFKSRFIRIALIAIILIPLAYGGMYLAAFWDPYGHTETIPVAVVNTDQGVIDEDGNRINRGQEIVENLYHNDDLGWNFVDDPIKAKEGLLGDQYYAIVIIPTDYSEKLEAIDDGKMEKPTIEFVANEKKNYILGLVNSKVAKALKTQIGNSMFETFTIKTFDQLYTLKDGMVNASEGTLELQNGMRELKDKVPVLQNGMDQLYDGAETFHTKMRDIVNGSKDLQEGVGTLKDKMPDLVEGTNELYEGSDQFVSKMEDASEGAKDLNEAVATLQDKIPAINDGVQTLYHGSDQLQGGISELQDKLPDLVVGISKISNGAGELKNGLDKAKDGVAELHTGIRDAASGAEDLAEGAKKVDVGFAQLKKQLEKQVMDEVDSQLSAQLRPMVTKISALQGAVTQIDAFIPIEQPVLKEKSTEAKMIADTVSSMVYSFGGDISPNNLGSLSSALKKVKDHLSTMCNDLLFIKSAMPVEPLSSSIDLIVGEVSSIPLEQLEEQLENQLKQPMTLLTALDRLGAGIDSLEAGNAKLAEGLGDAVPKVGELYSGVDELYEGSEDLQDGTSDLAAGVFRLMDGVDDLYDGSDNLKNGIGELSQKIPELEEGTNQLYEGTNDLSNGVFKLHEASIDLKDGIKELNDKAPELEEGAEELYDGTAELTDGTIKLYDASGDLQEGIEKVKDKIPDLEDGTNQLYEGVATLSDQLTDGAQELTENLIPSSKDLGTYMSDPVDLEEDPIYKVDNYGTGLTPYFVSLGLWVGALLMFFVITDEPKETRKVHPGATALGKYLFCGLIGTMQAVVLSFAVMKLGLDPSNVKVFILFNIFLSWVFIAIIQNLVFLLGDVGRLIAVVLLLFQLTSSGGTFPRELIPGFFQRMNPYMPFTYSISAIREIISGIDYSILTQDIQILSIVLIVFLTATVLLKKYANKVKKHLMIHPEEDSVSM